jgi:hypothetical protein
VLVASRQLLAEQSVQKCGCHRNEVFRFALTRGAPHVLGSGLAKWIVGITDADSSVDAMQTRSAERRGKDESGGAWRHALLNWEKFGLPSSSEVIG